MHPKLELRRVRDSSDPELSSLVARSDEYLSALYPPESNHAESIEALTGGDSYFFAGYFEGRLVACGAVKVVNDGETYGEIKRVFVDEGSRGQGFAGAVMNHLEAHLVNLGVTLARLEAGPKQPAALKFYRKIGYVERGPFGSYKADPLSVFMEKPLRQ